MPEHHMIAPAGTVLSTPAVVADRSGKVYGFGLILGSRDAGGTEQVACDLIDIQGRSLPGFPVLAQSRPYQVAPAPQVVALKGSAGGAAELVVIDLQGRLGRWSVTGQPDYGRAADPTRGLLISAPLVLTPPGQPPRLVLLSQDGAPWWPSRNAVHLVDEHGQSLPGFPVALPARPAPVPPRSGGGALYVLLENGQVVGLDQATGRALPGFPSAAPALWPVRPAMVLHAAWGGPVVSTGESRLLRIGAAGEVTEVLIAGARRIVGLASAAGQLLLLDAARGEVLVLDDAARVTRTLPLGGSVDDAGAGIESFGDDASALVAVVASAGGDRDARIGSAFAAHAPPEVDRQIRQLADETATRDFSTSMRDHMTRDQEAAYDRDLTEMKHSWLENNLGLARTGELLAQPPMTRILVVQAEATELRVLVDETITGHTRAAQGSLTPAPEPVLYQDARGWLLVVPLNAADTTGGAAAPPGRLVLWRGKA